MNVWASVALLVVGLVLIVAGVAVVFPPAGLVVAGVVCVAVSLTLEVRDP